MTSARNKGHWMIRPFEGSIDWIALCGTEEWWHNGKSKAVKHHAVEIPTRCVDCTECIEAFPLALLRELDI